MIIGIIMCIFGLIELELARRERKEQNKKIEMQNELIEKLINILEKK